MKVVTKNETIFIKDYGLKVLKYFIPSLSFSHVTEKVDGVDGELLIDSLYNSREIKVELLMISDDLKGLYNLKYRFNQLFAKREEFFIIFDREPWRRWRVKLNSPVNWEDSSLRSSAAEISFISFSSFSESVGTSLNPNLDTNFVQHLKNGVWDGFEPTVQYVFDTNTFSVWNDSDIIVDPRNKELSIKFVGASNNLSIENLTTNEIFIHNGTTISDDVIELKGVRHLKNNASIFKNTNRKTISLDVGWNEFSISGNTSDFQILVDSRFYYV